MFNFHNFLNIYNSPYIVAFSTKLANFQRRQTMIHISSAHKFLVRGKAGGKFFFIAFSCNNFEIKKIFGKIKFRKKHELVKFCSDFGKSNDFWAILPEYWQCTCTACTVVFGAPANFKNEILKRLDEWYILLKLLLMRIFLVLHRIALKD